LILKVSGFSDWDGCYWRHPGDAAGIHWCFITPERALSASCFFSGTAFLAAGIFNIVLAFKLKGIKNKVKQVLG